MKITHDSILKNQKTRPVRPGKVVFKIEYTVDLNNKDMVDHAKDAIAEDVDNAVKYNEVGDSIKIVRDKKAKASDIPEFLLEGDEDK